MSGFLKQRDIDLLLQGKEKSSSRESESIVPYTFLRPPQVGKDLRTTLDGIFTRYALSIQSLLSLRLRTRVDVTLRDIEQVAFAEFLLSLPVPCASFIFNVGERLAAHASLDVSTDLAYHLLDRLFGGTGEGSRPQRGLTSLEQRVIRGLADRLVVLLREAWQDRLPVANEILAYEANPEMLQFANREDNVLVAVLELRSGALGGPLTVCLPMMAVLAALENGGPLGKEPAPASEGTRRRNRVLIETCLRQASLSLSVRIPRVHLHARTLSNLRLGQILHTGHPVDAPVELHINGCLRYLGSLGQHRRHVSLKILQAVSGTDPERPGWGKEGRVL